MFLIALLLGEWMPPPPPSSPQSESERETVWPRNGIFDSRNMQWWRADCRLTSIEPKQNIYLGSWTNAICVTATFAIRHCGCVSFGMCCGCHLVSGWNSQSTLIVVVSIFCIIYYFWFIVHCQTKQFNELNGKSGRPDSLSSEFSMFMAHGFWCRESF